MKTLDYYRAEDGRCPFEEWLNTLRDKPAKRAIAKRLAYVQLGSMGDCKSVGDGVFELRIHQGPGYRLYIGQEGDSLVILLSGSDKSGQDAEIRRAKQYLTDYRRLRDAKPV